MVDDVKKVEEIKKAVEGENVEILREEDVRIKLSVYLL